jgi:hypothetical protein
MASGGRNAGFIRQKAPHRQGLCGFQHHTRLRSLLPTEVGVPRFMGSLHDHEIAHCDLEP